MYRIKLYEENKGRARSRSRSRSTPPRRANRSRSRLAHLIVNQNSCFVVFNFFVKNYQRKIVIVNMLNI